MIASALPIAAISGVAVLLLAAVPARAADEEIQVYMDEIGPPHVATLDVHLNYVPQGRTAPDYPGEEASGGRFRVTPEWAYALNPNLEFGAYLPLAEIRRDGGAEIGGAKARVKWVAPKAAGQDWFWGLNFEIGRVRHDVDRNPWNAELKGIAGVRKGPWTLAANLNVDWVVQGPDHGPPDLQLATKLAYALDKDTSIGVESYDAIGTTKRFTSFDRSDHQVFLVMDRSFGRWDLDLGIGRGYGAPEDRWILKAIVGVPIA
jgi:hypothetical protein